MLPPALGGLRVCVPPVPGHPAPGSVSKISFQGDYPLATPQLYQKAFLCGGDFFVSCRFQNRKSCSEQNRNGFHALAATQANTAGLF